MKQSNPVWQYWSQEFQRNPIYFQEWDGWDQYVDNFQKTQDIKSELIYGRHQAKAVISIVIPAYREPELLARALDSALNQKFDLPYEVMVVDDSGSPEYLGILMQNYCALYPNLLYYANERNLGANDCWNRTITLCRTSWFCMLHHDDELYSRYLADMYAAIPDLDKHQVGVISPMADLVTDESGASQSLLTKIYGQLVRIRRNSPIFLDIHDALKSVFPHPVAMLINQERTIAVGGLNADYGVVSDSVFFAQLQLKYRNALFPKVLAISHKEVGAASNSSEVAKFSLISAFRRTKAIATTLGYSELRATKFAQKAFCFAAFALLNLADSDLLEAQKLLEIPERYFSNFSTSKLQLQKNWNWFRLLFRKG
jgi:glycosyltransferase involved in cell wall biosynthesis